MLTFRIILLLFAISFWWLSWNQSLGEWIEIVQTSSMLNKQENTNLIPNNKVYLFSSKPQTFTIGKEDNVLSDKINNLTGNLETDNENQNNIEEIEIKVKLPNSSKKSIVQNNDKDKNDKDIFKQKGKSSNSSAPQKLEFPSIEGFIRFLQNMQNVWIKKSIFRVEDKIRSLYALKDNLYERIKQQFERLIHIFIDKEMDQTSLTGHSLHRSKRGLLDESNIQFSPEATMMSINFLTFAVFLIKLVLQIVNIVKNRQYTMNTLNLTPNVKIKN